METISKIEAAKLLGVSRRSIHRWIENGFLPITQNKLDISDILRLKDMKFVGFNKGIWDYEFFSRENEESAIQMR